MNIIFIGGGNMATALIAGLIRARANQVSIHVVDPSEDARKRAIHQYGLEASAELPADTGNADVIVLAIKPQMMEAVLQGLAAKMQAGQLVLSVAAGTTIAGIQSGLGGGQGAAQPVIRAMPNTPALIGHGACGLFASENCKPHHREQAECIMRAAGDVVWVNEESQMDVVTAVSGSGPAYFFLLTEALARAGAELGLSEEDALKLALRTAEGAGAMLLASEDSPETLRKKVTSPGGTTQAALEAFEAGGFRDLVHAAVKAAVDRGRELAG